ncbi:hypothetical protein B2J93_448 [Marssonina coronariae]|uniref:Uncharacterized protein n=1 Tax=Diplocarpon coronariae TaxID=2795749 RepID=A0A218YT87_9HELO|nr:hypothetical protein B2J93_448 [Marssonina coronariae]
MGAPHLSDGRPSHPPRSRRCPPADTAAESPSRATRVGPRSAFSARFGPHGSSLSATGRGRGPERAGHSSSAFPFDWRRTRHVRRGRSASLRNMGLRCDVDARRSVPAQVAPVEVGVSSWTSSTLPPPLHSPSDTPPAVLPRPGMLVRFNLSTLAPSRF